MVARTFSELHFRPNVIQLNNLKNTRNVPYNHQNHTILALKFLKFYSPNVLSQNPAHTYIHYAVKTRCSTESGAHKTLCMGYNMCIDVSCVLCCVLCSTWDVARLMCYGYLLWCGVRCAKCTMTYVRCHAQCCFH